MFAKLKEQWIYDDRYIEIKKAIRVLLRKIYKLKPWHDDPLNAKPYAAYIVKNINSRIEEENIRSVVEIGCGLGDIIGNINLHRGKIGYDITRETVKCARLLHPTTSFQVGSYDSVQVGKIDLLIIAGVLHRISDEELSKWFNCLKKNNDIKEICVDTQLRATSDYPCVHEYHKIIGNEYHLINRSRGFMTIGNNRRYIEFYKK